jgi:hypothetical protein
MGTCTRDRPGRCLGISLNSLHLVAPGRQAFGRQTRRGGATVDFVGAPNSSAKTWRHLGVMIFKHQMTGIGKMILGRLTR